MVNLFTTRWTVHRIHKWLGLIAAVWLIVLGLTGFLIDHRDTWRWLWQEGLSEKWINEDVVHKSKKSEIKYYQINPENPQMYVAGGLTGLWFSINAGKNWKKTQFINADNTPMISTIFYAANNHLWIASDNGIWLSKDGGKSAVSFLLDKKWVSSLSYDVNSNQLIGVTDRTSIFKYAIDNGKINWLDIHSVKEKDLPNKISLSRFIRDVHYGRGVFYIPLSLLWNDITAIAMIVLPLTGFLFYWLPRRWKKHKNKQKKIGHKYKKHSIRWLFRLHGPTFGLISAIPLVYLSLTGILLDHSEGLRSWMKSISVTRSWQTPVYNLSSWDGEIYDIIHYPNISNKFSIGTRLGLFTTVDNGKKWQREKLVNDQSLFVWTLRRHKENIYIGGMGGPNMVKINQQDWSAVKGVGHMPSDITLDEKENWVWKSKHGIKTGTLESGFTRTKLSFPVSDYIPWFYIVDGLHSGVLIHSQWKWINDFIAVLAIFLVFTGIIRWWNKKWI